MNGFCTKLILIGGSAGSFPALERILQNLPERLRACIVIILHRPKNAPSAMAQVLSTIGPHEVIEPEDKQTISDGKILLVPRNYHLLAEDDGTSSLDYSEAELHSRPSINVSFESFGAIYREDAMAIVLGGLNSDGAQGMRSLLANGGQAYILDPAECEFGVMPEAAKATNPLVAYKTLEELIAIIINTTSETL